MENLEWKTLGLDFFSIGIALIHFSSVFHFYTPYKLQKIKGFLAFSEGYRNGTLGENGLTGVFTTL